MTSDIVEQMMNINRAGDKINGPYENLYGSPPSKNCFDVYHEACGMPNDYKLTPNHVPIIRTNNIIVPKATTTTTTITTTTATTTTTTTTTTTVAALTTTMSTIMSQLNQIPYENIQKEKSQAKYLENYTAIKSILTNDPNLLVMICILILSISLICLMSLALTFIILKTCQKNSSKSNARSISIRLSFIFFY